MRRNGQAIVEFVVAIVVVSVLVAGMVQLGLLQKAHTDVMAEARKAAGENSLKSADGENPDYVGSVKDGPDEVNYSADDESPDGNSADLLTKLINYSNPGELEGKVGDNAMTSAFSDATRVMDGFVHGESSKTVTLLPVIENLVAGTDSIEVKSDVWMVRLGNID